MSFVRPINRVGIIGAGAGGLVAARALLAEQSFSTIEILEQRGEPGGVWNYTPQVSSAPLPSEDPHVVEEPLPASASTKLIKEPVFLSALYDALETNIPKPLMRFTTHAFPEQLQLFPKHADVRTYLHGYARDVQHLITFHAQVTDVQKLPSFLPASEHGGEWRVEYIDTRTGVEQSPRYYDAIVVAAGHYNIPYIPSVPGMQAWEQAYPGSITHSKYFRNAEPYRGKKVVVVGNAASGIDIAGQILEVSQRPVLQSRKSASYLATGKVDGIEELGEIVEFVPEGRVVKFIDGTEERDVDNVLYATGYLHSLPFLSTLNAGADAPITTGERVRRAYALVFNIPDPTLSYIGLPIKAIPFPVSEAQACVVARVYSGRLSLPSEEAMREWEAQQIEEKGDGREFHYFNFPKDAEYLDWLGQLVAQAKAPSDEAAENGEGLQPPKWGEKERWMRERFPRIRKAFVEAKKHGLVATRIEEVGYDFENGLDGAQVDGVDGVSGADTEEGDVEIAKVTL